MPRLLRAFLMSEHGVGRQTWDLEAQARKLVRNLEGRLGPSAYDTAWMARVPSEDGQGARWPELIGWLIEHQWLDGSWGGALRYYHDRVICTLAALIALREHGEGREAEDAIERGERYIWHNVHRLRYDPFELAGFELILPALLTEALAVGLDIPTHTCGYGQVRQEKLALIPSDLLYSPGITTIHVLEFLGREGDPQRMRQALAANGSLGNSPATTSYYLLRGGSDERALAYLQDLLTENQWAVCVYPCRTFQMVWSLHGLAFCGRPFKSLVDESVWRSLRAEMGERGLSVDPTLGILDGNMTSVGVYLLALAGYSISPGVLARFEDPQRHLFRTYDYERNVSIGTNVHALEALNLLPDYPGREEVRNCIVNMLLAGRIYGAYWTDKWHASPYSITAHTLIALLTAVPELREECRSTVEWLIHTQREDGSWGFFDQGTAEETAYSLIALLYCHRYFSIGISRKVLHRGACFLYRESEMGNARYPELYIAKCLFVPQDVVRATILAAMMLYEESFGWPPE